MMSRFFFVSRSFVLLELEQLVIVLINTVHFQLEHYILWSLCLSLS